MRVSVFGLGYVGSVTATCIAQDGHTVLGLDANPQKLALVGAGSAPIIEEGLDELMHAAVRSGRLQVTRDSRAAVHETDVSIICVGTPSSQNGSLSLRYLENVCREIAVGLADKSEYHVVVVRSTVLAGTTEEHLIPLLEHETGRRAGRDFGVCVNPEFLREGSAIEDYYHPSYVVIGALDQRSGDLVEALYAAVQAPVVRTDIKTAEMLKYANNAFHALKITFANEIGNFCKARGVDGRKVMDLLCQDRRLNISPTYLKPGFAFGGSCLPKDLRALLYRAKQLDLDCPLLSAVWQSNQRQIQRGIEMVERSGRKKVGVLGLSFKAGTDDVRESPVVPLIETLVGRGYQVSIYDEKVELARLIGTNKTFLEQQIPHISSLMRRSIAEVLEQAEVVVIANNSAAFRQVPEQLRNDQVLVDLVGIVADKNATRGGYDGICW
jgi:GDP-mannose 6-dehydrogenase